MGFGLEKATSAEKMRKTAATFLLEAYVPEEAQPEPAQSCTIPISILMTRTDGIFIPINEYLPSLASGMTDTVWYKFSQPSEDETPPTLLKNNKVVKN